MSIWDSEVASYTVWCPHYLTRCLDHSRHSGWMNGFILPPLPLPLNGSSGLYWLLNCHIHFPETNRWPSVPKLPVASLRPEVHPLRAPGIWPPPPRSYSLRDTWRLRDSGLLPAPGTGSLFLPPQWPWTRYRNLIFYFLKGLLTFAVELSSHQMHCVFHGLPRWPNNRGCKWNHSASSNAIFWQFC